MLGHSLTPSHIIQQLLHIRLCMGCHAGAPPSFVGSIHRFSPGSSLVKRRNPVLYANLCPLPSAIPAAAAAAVDPDMALVSGPGRAVGAMPAEMQLYVDKHVRYIQSLDTVRLPS